MVLSSEKMFLPIALRIYLDTSISIERFSPVKRLENLNLLLYFTQTYPCNVQ